MRVGLSTIAFYEISGSDLKPLKSNGLVINTIVFCVVYVVSNFGLCGMWASRVVDVVLRLTGNDNLLS